MIGSGNNCLHRRPFIQNGEWETRSLQNPQIYCDGKHTHKKIWLYISLNFYFISLYWDVIWLGSPSRTIRTQSLLRDALQIRGNTSLWCSQEIMHDDWCSVVIRSQLVGVVYPASCSLDFSEALSAVLNLQVQHWITFILRPIHWKWWIRESRSIFKALSEHFLQK
jgi:hypothetical protein